VLLALQQLRLEQHAITPPLGRYAAQVVLPGQAAGSGASAGSPSRARGQRPASPAVPGQGGAQGAGSSGEEEVGASERSVYLEHSASSLGSSSGGSGSGSSRLDAGEGQP
jgi:hypothetical protein